MTVFHKQEPPWYEAVKDLAPGGKRRIADGKLASFNGRAYMVYDFREKEAEVYEPQLTFADRVRLARARQEADNAASKSSILPGQALFKPRDWPLDGRTWMYRAGLTDDDLMDMQAYWSGQLDRVVMPLTMLDGSHRWIARAVDGRAPKYIFPQGMSRGGGALVRQGEPDRSEAVIITEDYLSAWRTTQALGLDSVAALGVTLDRDAMVRIARTYSEAGVWLDPDKWGQAGGTQIMRELQRLGVRARIVKSERDPKLHDDDQLNEAWERTWRT